MSGSDDLLQNDCHLFFFEPVGRGPQVRLRARGEHRGVDALDRAHELAQTHLRFGMAVRQHVRFVDAGERLILRVFEEARRPDRERIADDVEQRGQLAHHGLRKIRRHEAAACFLLVVGVDDEIAQVVHLEELVEHVRADHDRGRYGDRHVCETVAHLVLRQQVVHESEAACLAAERSTADA